MSQYQSVQILLAGISIFAALFAVTSWITVARWATDKEIQAKLTQVFRDTYNPDRKIPDKEAERRCKQNVDELHLALVNFFSAICSASFSTAIFMGVISLRLFLSYAMR
jgi:hypothetical protein